jgi:UDP-N-acetylmuramyl pentapeptide synthase
MPVGIGFSAGELAELLAGKWTVLPDKSLRVYDFYVNTFVKFNHCENACFVAIDTDTWLKGSGDTGVYANWVDGHSVLPGLAGKKEVACAIVQHPVAGLPDGFPQLVVGNSYNVFLTMAKYVRKRMTGPIAAITGTAGKSTVTAMVNHLLKGENIIATRGNANARTHVAMTLARCVTNPGAGIFEIAVSALWTKDGGVCTYLKPHVCVITNVGYNQTKVTRDIRATAIYKSRIANGITPGGVCLLYDGMEEFEFVRGEVLKYGAVPRTYGFDKSCDSHPLSFIREGGGFTITADILGERADYFIPVIGNTMVVNSIAALSVVKLLGFDITKKAGNFKTFRGNPSVMEVVRQKIPGGEAIIIDDSHNATMVSTLAALNVFKDETAYAKAKRKIAVLGSIVELEDQSPALHESLAAPLLALKPDKVFLHGNDMKYLADKLPQEMVGGLFHDVRKLGDTVADFIRDGDYILLKGSHGGSNFYEIRQHLTAALRTALSVSKSAPDLSRESLNPNAPCSAAVCYLDEPSGTPVFEGTGVMREGLGGALILTQALSLIASKRISLADKVVCTDYAARQGGDPRSAGLISGETVPLITLLALIIIKNAPDAMVAVADHMARVTGEQTMV